MRVGVRGYRVSESVPTKSRAHADTIISGASVSGARRARGLLVGEPAERDATCAVAGRKKMLATQETGKISHLAACLVAERREILGPYPAPDHSKGGDSHLPDVRILP